MRNLKMKKIFQFKCSQCSEEFDEYTVYKKETTCPECGGLANKLISAPRVKLEGWSGQFPGAAMQWEKRHKMTRPSEEEV